MALDTRSAARKIESSLRQVSDPDRAVQEKRYLKSSLRHLGVTVPAIRRTAKEFLSQREDLTREELVDLVERLWGEPVHERRMVAVELLDLRQPLLRADDIGLIERLIRESGTWALVDGLAASVAGPLVERFPELGRVLDRWARDDDFWLRRSAILALGPLRAGDGDFARFGRYADEMLDEREFFVRKAIGWVLRETAKKRPELVYEWLLPRAGRASGVTVREAVKYLPDDERAAILERHRARRP